MARIPDNKHQSAQDQDNEQELKQLRRDQFVERWLSSSEKERAEMVFLALWGKADKDHRHPHDEGF